jgi:hypothetical protein
MDGGSYKKNEEDPRKITRLFNLDRVLIKTTSSEDPELVLIGAKPRSFGASPRSKEE